MTEWRGDPCVRPGTPDPCHFRVFFMMLYNRGGVALAAPPPYLFERFDLFSKEASMKAVVMAGGEGSRLRPLTIRRPKPMVPIAGKPVMEHILNLLKRHGITDVIVTVQYLASNIEDYFGNGSQFGMRITYSREDVPLGTAGSVKNAEDQLTEPFLVISGDRSEERRVGKEWRS